MSGGSPAHSIPLRSFSESCREELERLKWNGSLWIGGYFRKVTLRRSPWSSLDLLQRFKLIDPLAVGVDWIHRSFEPMRRQVEEWRQAQITDERAKLILYAAFVDGEQKRQERFSPKSTGFTCNQSTRNFRRERCGACRTRLPACSRNWIPSRNSRQPPSRANSRKPGSHNRSSARGGVGSPRLPNQ